MPAIYPGVAVAFRSIALADRGGADNDTGGHERAARVSKARHHAEHVLMAGELLVIHPEFTRCFAGHYPNVEAKDALLHLCQFLVCATDGRTRVPHRWVQESKPVDQFGGESN